MKKRNLAGLGTMLCMLLMGSTVYGYDPSDLDRLMTTNQCAECDLSGASLISLVMVRQDLNSSNLSGAALGGANLSGTDLSGANLSGTDLRWANLSGTDLTAGANLSGANLLGANLEGADLDGVNLDSAVWTDGQRCKPGSIGKCLK